MSEPSLKILVIEDHTDLREALVEALSSLGHQVNGLGSAEEFAESSASQRIDLLIVDLNLPGEDGLSLTQRVREYHPNVGIIMVTARGLVTDKTAGYDSGADIYITKPASLDEIKAAIRSLSKRLLPVQSGMAVVLDAQRCCLTGEQGQSITISIAESAVLCALVRASEHRLEVWQLIEAMNKDPDSYSKAALELVIVRLRKRLSAIGLPGSCIRAIRGWDYQLLVPLEVR